MFHYVNFYILLRISYNLNTNAGRKIMITDLESSSKNKLIKKKKRYFCDMCMSKILPEYLNLIIATLFL